MIGLTRIATFAALAAVASNATALGSQVQVQPNCVTTSEATSIALVAMPEAMRSVGQICATRLPASSLLRQPGSSFFQQYQSEADRAWPVARAALGRVAGAQVAPLLQSDFTRPVLVSLLAQALVAAIKPSDCTEFDRIVTLAEPLPPRNAAGLIVAVLELTRDKQALFSDATIDVPICRNQG